MKIKPKLVESAIRASGQVAGKTKPKPPLPLFEGWAADRKRWPMRAPDKSVSFEPSAAAAYVDPQTKVEQLVVLNDFWDPTQYQFALNAKGALVPGKRQARAVMKLAGSTEPYAPKLEAISRLNDGRFLATTAFNRDGAQFRRVVAFEAAKPGKVPVAREVRFDAEAFERYVKGVTGQPWLQVEGLAVDPKGKNVFFGVRFSGESREGVKRPEVMLVRCGFDGKSIGEPKSHVRLSTQRALGRREGLADLQRDPKSGDYWLLTSHEGDDVTDLANNAGHLFKLPAAVVEGKTSARELSLGKPLRSFQGKPEAVTTMKDGKLVVIFDDDREWKDNFAGYARSMAMYEVVTF